MESELKQNFIDDCAKLKKARDDFNEMVQKIEQVVDYATGPLFDMYWACFDIALEAVAKRYGIEVEAMQWFVWENEFGEKRHSCVKDVASIEVEITGPETFWDFEKFEG